MMVTYATSLFLHHIITSMLQAVAAESYSPNHSGIARLNSAADAAHTHDTLV